MNIQILRVFVFQSVLILRASDNNALASPLVTFGH